MKFEIYLSKDVRKFLDKRDSKFIKKLKELFEKLGENPYNHPELDIKKLRNIDADYRLRVGKYRLLYSVLEEKILIYIYRADSRGDVYKKR